MNRADEAAKILAAVINGDFHRKEHADTRSLERTISLAEISNIAKSHTRWSWQEDKQTHLFVGYRDADMQVGGGFSAILDESGAVIVTVFKRKLSKRERAPR